MKKLINPVIFLAKDEDDNYIKVKHMKKYLKSFDDEDILMMAYPEAGATPVVKINEVIMEATGSIYNNDELENITLGVLQDGFNTGRLVRAVLLTSLDEI